MKQMLDRFWQVIKLYNHYIKEVIEIFSRNGKFSLQCIISTKMLWTLFEGFGFETNPFTSNLRNLTKDLTELRWRVFRLWIFKLCLSKCFQKIVQINAHIFNFIFRPICTPLGQNITGENVKWLIWSRNRVLTYIKLILNSYQK